METEIVQFIRRSTKDRVNKIGVLIGTAHTNKYISIGWSKVKSPSDVFDKDIGINLARSRAETGLKITIPHSIQKDCEQFEKRCLRYFKGMKLFPTV